MDPVGRILPNLLRMLAARRYRVTKSRPPTLLAKTPKGARVVIHLITDDKVGVKGVRDTIEGLPAGTKRLILVVGQQLTTFAKQEYDKTPRLATELFTFQDFRFDPTAHAWVPPHELVADPGALQNMKLPTILPTDRIAKWLGLVKNDVVRIRQTSPEGHYYYEYRVCGNASRA